MRLSSLCRVAAVVLAILLPGAAQAQIADLAVVNAGESAVVARSSKRFTKVEPDLGQAIPVESGGTPNGYALVYFPPAGTLNAEVKIRYTPEGEDAVRIVPVRIQVQAPTLTGELYEKSFKALFILFVLAVLVENGLDLLFRWRPFVSYFETRSVNPLVSFLLSFAFVSLFHLDIATGLLNVYSEARLEPGLPGMVLTAMIIAGGSAGVNRIFRALGFRPLTSEAELAMAEKPPQGRAWISVKLDALSKATGTLSVQVGPVATPAIAGTIEAGRGPVNRLVSFFVRDRHRFPQSGGYAILPNTECKIILSGYDATGALICDSWGPFTAAPGAIIDTVLNPRRA